MALIDSRLVKLADAGTMTSYVSCQFPQFRTDISLGGGRFGSALSLLAGGAFSANIELRGNEPAEPWEVTCEGSISMGGASLNILEDWGHPYTDIANGGQILITGTYPVALCANISRYDRYNYNGSLWGPVYDTVDLRDYRSAAIGYYYWGGGSVTVSVPGKSWTLSGGDEPTGFLTAASFQMQMLDLPFGDEDAEGYLTCGHLGRSPEWADTLTTYPDIYGNEVYVQTRGGNRIEFRHDAASEAQAWGMTATIEPPRSFALGLIAENASGKQFAPATFQVSPYDGPDYAVDAELPASTEWPVGTPIAAVSPGPAVGGTGHAYTWAVTAQVLGSSTQLATDTVDTIGAPAFAFRYLGAEHLKWERDAFRVPIGIGNPWSALQFEVLESATLDDFADAGGWTAGAGSTLTVSGGAGSLTAASGTREMSCTYDNTSGVRSLRYIDIRWKAASGTANVTLSDDAGKEWAAEIGDSYETTRIDLCAPDNLSGVAYDSTVYERDYSAGAAGYSQGDWGWGWHSGVVATISADADIDIDSIVGIGYDSGSEASGTVYVTEAVHRDARTRGADVGADETRMRPVLNCIQNGKLALQEEAGYVTLGTGASGEDEATAKSINQLYVDCGNIRRQAGSLTEGVAKLTTLAASAAASTVKETLTYYEASNYLNNHLPAWMLKPGKTALQNNLAVINGQCVVDRVEPMAGTTLTLSSRVVFGGALHGLVATPAPVVGGSVQIRENNVGDALIDTASTNSRGLYFAPVSVPGAHKHADGYRVIPLGQDASDGEIGGIQWGMLERCSMAAEAITVTGEGLSLWHSVTGEVYRAYGEDGRVMLDRYRNGVWGDAVDLWDGANPGIIGFDSVRTRPIRIYYIANGSVYSRTSTDDGASWGAETLLIAGATKHAVCHDPQAGVSYIVYFDGTGISMRQSFDNGATFGSALTVAATADDDNPDMVILYEWDGTKRARKLLVSYRSGGNLISVASSDNGVTWS